VTVRWPWGRTKARLDPDLRKRIRESFNEAAADEEHFPSSIDPRIYHVQLLLQFFGELGDKRVLDAGCGKGRFARVIADRNPKVRIYGMDISEEMLRRVPNPIHRCAGSLTELPFGDGIFDAAYATESLEHAVEIDRAVAELCRVVAPGGKIAIIDKNAEHWGKLKTPEWEKWFGRRELEKLLRRDCEHVESRMLSYWEDVAPDGLFIAWLARR
jgi:ubiquinone/menaquinone biosynthesis C-methylase UbiE